MGRLAHALKLEAIFLVYMYIIVYMYITVYFCEGKLSENVGLKALEAVWRKFLHYIAVIDCHTK